MAAVDAAHGGLRLATAVVKGALFVGLLQGATKVLGFLEKIILGHVYGTESPAYAAYLVAFEVLLVTSEVLKLSAIPSLVPSLEAARGQAGDAAARRLTRRFGTLLVLAVLGLVTVPTLVWGGPFLRATFAKVWLADPARQAYVGLMVDFVRVLMGGAVFIAAGVCTYALLNSYRRFVPAALGDVAFKVLGLASFVFVGFVLGLRERAIFGLVGGIVAGCVGFVGVHLIALRIGRRSAIGGQPSAVSRPVSEIQDLRPKIGDLRRTLVLFLPLLLSVLLFNSRRLLDKFFTARMELADYVAAQDFGWRFVETVYRLAIEPFAIVLLPFLAGLATGVRNSGDGTNRDTRDGQDEAETKGAEQPVHPCSRSPVIPHSAFHIPHTAFARAAWGSIRVLLVILVPVSVGFYLLRYPFIQVLLEHGRFDAVSTFLTCEALKWYIIALALWGLDVIMQRVCFAMQEMVRPLAFEVLAMAVYVMVCITSGGLRQEGVALAFAASRAVKVALLALFLTTRTHPKKGDGKGSRPLFSGIGFIGRLGLAAVALGAPVYGIARLLDVPHEVQVWASAAGARVIRASEDGGAAAWRLRFVIPEAGAYRLWLVGGAGPVEVSIDGRPAFGGPDDGTATLTSGLHEIAVSDQPSLGASREASGPVRYRRVLFEHLVLANNQGRLAGFTPDETNRPKDFGPQGVVTWGPQGARPRRMVVLIVGTVVGLFMYLAALRLLRVEELSLAWRLLRSREGRQT